MQGNHQSQPDFATLWRVVWRRKRRHQMILFADAHFHAPWFQDYFFKYVKAVIGTKNTLIYMNISD